MGGRRTIAGPAEVSRRRRRVAIACSTGAHLLVLAHLLTAQAGSLIATEGPGPAAMQVTIVSMPRSSPADAAPLQGRLKPLIAKLGSDQPPVFLDDEPPVRTDLEALADRARQLVAAPAPAATRIETLPLPRPSPTFSERPAEQAQAQPQRSAGASGGASGGSTGGLWGRIEPCWRAHGGRVSVPVRLQVALDLRGDLAGPPTILRGNAPIDEARLTSEANALAAISSCLPKGEWRFRGRAFLLEFPSG